MKILFEIVFLEEAFEFLKGLEKKHYEKILYNIRKSQINHDPELFKKLTDEIWEFRTLYQGLQYRLLAFWDKTSSTQTLVISTHGFIKKRSKVPDNEVQMDLIGKAIKETRKERNLTQEELGKLVGVQKAQISRLESNASNATMDTLLKVFSALKAKVTLQVELPNLNISVGK